MQGNHPGRAGADASEGGLIMLVGLKSVKAFAAGKIELLGVDEKA